jgi:hypothetical protein
VDGLLTADCGTQGRWDLNLEPSTSNIQHRTSNIEHPTSNIQHPTSNIEHPTSNIQHPTSNIQHPTLNGDGGELRVESAEDGGRWTVDGLLTTDWGTTEVRGHESVEILSTMEDTNYSNAAGRWGGENQVAFKRAISGIWPL